MTKSGTKWLLLASLIGAPGLVLASPDQDSPASGQQPQEATGAGQTGAGQDRGGQAASGQEGQVGQAQDPGQLQGKGVGGTASVSQEFLRNPNAILGLLHVDSQNEIQLGELAQERASSNEVKQYAERLVKEHRKADERVQQIAKEMNVQISQALPQELVQMQKRQTAKLNQLKNLKGVQFDRQFLGTIVEAHEQTIAILGQAQQYHKDNQVGTLVNELLPNLRAHLQEARQLHEQIQRTPVRARRPAQPVGQD